MSSLNLYRASLLTILVSLLFLQCLFAQAQDSKIGLALLIANGEYDHEETLDVVLDRDLPLLSQTFWDVGLDTILAVNASYEDMTDKLDHFSKELKKYDFGLIYYSGHGIRTDSVDYLLPVDYRDAGRSKTMKGRAYNPEEIILKSSIKKKAGEANIPRVIVIDACRSKPEYEKTKSVGDLERQEKLSQSLVVYSAGAGIKVPQNNLFARLFAKELKEGGDLEVMFKNIGEVLLSLNAKHNIDTYSKGFSKRICINTCESKDSRKYYDEKAFELIKTKLIDIFNHPANNRDNYGKFRSKVKVGQLERQNQSDKIGEWTNSFNEKEFKTIDTYNLGYGLDELDNWIVTNEEKGINLKIQNGRILWNRSLNGKWRSSSSIVPIGSSGYSKRQVSSYFFMGLPMYAFVMDEVKHIIEDEALSNLFYKHVYDEEGEYVTDFTISNVPAWLNRNIISYKKSYPNIDTQLSARFNNSTGNLDKILIESIYLQNSPNPRSSNYKITLEFGYVSGSLLPHQIWISINDHTDKNIFQLHHLSNK